MKNKIVLGPLLGYEGDDNYSISLLTDKDEEVKEVTAEIDGKTFLLKKEEDTFSGHFWCVRFPVKVISQGKGDGNFVTYTLKTEGQQVISQQGETSWSFYVPHEKEDPRIAYTSCNGFSSAELTMSTEDPYYLWRKMQETHMNQLEGKPFSLMIMGGDQVYADEVWSKVKSLSDWTESSVKDQIAKKVSATLSTELDEFYEHLYIARFNRKEVAAMLASIPTVMMWDDHDIFDGWGSYPAEPKKNLQGCGVFKEIFKAASKYFRIFQLRCKPKDKMLNKDGLYFGFGLHFRDYTILAMDHRSQRSIKQIMSAEQWDEMGHWLDNNKVGKNLLALSAVPVVFRDFAAVETAVNLTWWAEEITDDLKDHWRAKEHQGERLKLIHRLLDNLKQRQDNLKKKQVADPTARTIILSGDVHVGSIGVIMDRREAKERKIYQLVSSAIVHPTPTGLQWAGIMATTNDRNEYLNEDKKIETSVLKPIGSDTYIRARNFATLQEGTDKKLWINWINESKDEPVYPLE